MASSNNGDVCIAGSSTKDGVQAKLVAKHFIKNVGAMSQTFIFPGPPSLLFGDSRNKEAIKVEKRPSVSLCYAPLLLSLADIYMARNNM